MIFSSVFCIRGSFVSPNTCDTANKTTAIKKDPFFTIPGTFLNNEETNAIPSSAKQCIIKISLVFIILLMKT